MERPGAGGKDVDKGETADEVRRPDSIRSVEGNFECHEAGEVKSKPKGKREKKKKKAKPNPKASRYLWDLRRLLT